MRTGIFQFAPVFGDKTRNLDRVERAVSGSSFDLLVLPELFATGYQFESRDEAMALAEEVPSGPTSDRLEALAQASGGIVVAGLAERRQERLFNSAVIVGPEGLLGIYRKVHLFREEKMFFDPGQEGFEVLTRGGIRLGVLICFDWLFPEAARTLALKGADILCQPANLVLGYCQQAMTVRAIENRMFTITANRTGSEQRGGKPGMTFTGRSQVVSPKGELLLKFGPDEEGFQTVEIDPEEARNKLITPENDVLRDRRPDLYWR